MADWGLTHAVFAPDSWLADGMLEHLARGLQEVEITLERHAPLCRLLQLPARLLELLGGILVLLEFASQPLTNYTPQLNARLNNKKGSVEFPLKRLFK